MRNNGSKSRRSATSTTVKERFAHKSTPVFELKVLIRPGLPKEERQTIEDALMEAGCEVAGGSGSRDGGQSDISLRVDSVRSKLPTVIAILRAARVGEDSAVVQELPSDVVYQVYADSDEVIARIPLESKPRWWKFW